MADHYEDGQLVCIKDIGEEARIDRTLSKRKEQYTYSLVGHVGMFFYHDDLEPVEEVNPRE